MRLDPDKEMELVVRRAGLRFCCNWLWPFIVLAAFLWDITHLEGNTEWWHWMIDIVWYFGAAVWWKRDVRKLREVRDQLREAHR